jgi:hypothetical protein
MGWLEESGAGVSDGPLCINVDAAGCRDLVFGFFDLMQLIKTLPKGLIHINPESTSNLFPSAAPTRSCRQDNF